MGSHEEHMESVKPLSVAVAISFGYFVYTITLNLSYSIGFSILAYILPIVGAKFPDIDHHSAKPHRQAKWLIGSVVFLSLAYIVFQEASLEVSEDIIMWSLILWLLIGNIIIQVVSRLSTAFTKAMPKHRGVTHTKIGSFLFAGGVGAVVGYYASPIIGILATFAVFLGSLDHLSVDGLIDEFGELAEAVVLTLLVVGTARILFNLFFSEVVLLSIPTFLMLHLHILNNGHILNVDFGK
jgi:hypothetical protein